MGPRGRDLGETGKRKKDVDVGRKPQKRAGPV